MEWLYPKRRGPEWKQGWTEQTLSNISAPPLPLMAVFGIVVFLLSVSQYSNYKSQLNNTKINFHLFLLLVPVLLIFFMRSGITVGKLNLNFWSPRLRPDPSPTQRGGAPWGVAMLVVLLLVLVSYQSAFRSKWFAPLWRSDY